MTVRTKKAEKISAEGELQNEIRSNALDGIRGYVALSVVLFHLYSETYGDLFPVFRFPLIHFLINGTLDVLVFFVLSGQALSLSFFRTKDVLTIHRLAIKRYPRLTIPVFFSCLLVFILMKAGLTYNSEAGAIVNRMDWFGGSLHFQPTVIGLLNDALIKEYQTASDYNMFLWTIKWELIGSICVFAILYFYQRLRKPMIVFCGLGLLGLVLPSVMAQFISCFFFGLALSQLQADGALLAFKRDPSWLWISFCLLAALVVADQLVFRFFPDALAPNVLIAVLLVFIAQTNPAIERFLGQRLSSFLGKISFPLYLVHFPVIVSLMSYLIILASAHGGLTIERASEIGAVTLIVCIVAASLFLVVEHFTNIVCNRLANWAFPRQPYRIKDSL